jgi:hypothetical protein
MVQEVVHLDPGHPEDCAIQLYNVSQEMMGIWAARYSYQSENRNIKERASS